MLHRRVSPVTLGLARIAVYGMWLWHLARDPLIELARLPASLVSPIGVLRLLPGAAFALLLTEPALAALEALLLACLAALVLGAGPFRPLATATCVLLVVYQGLVRGVGYITHGELAMLYAAIALAPFPCTDALAVSRPAGARGRDPLLHRAPMLAAALALCLTYSFVGARRLEAGGLAIFLDGTIVQQIVLRAAERDGLGLVLLEHAWLARLSELGFPIVTAFEVLSPLVLFHPWFRRTWIVVMFAFHALTATLMAISFRGNLVLIAVFLTDSDRVLRAVLRRLPATMRARIMRR